MPIELHSAQRGANNHPPNGCMVTGNIAATGPANAAPAFQWLDDSARVVLQYNSTTSAHAFIFSNTTDVASWTQYSSASTVQVNINTANAWVVRDSSSNSLIDINTNASPTGAITFGNATTHPNFVFAGNGYLENDLYRIADNVAGAYTLGTSALNYQVINTNTNTEVHQLNAASTNNFSMVNSTSVPDHQRWRTHAETAMGSDFQFNAVINHGGGGTAETILEVDMTDSLIIGSSTSAGGYFDLKIVATRTSGGANETQVSHVEGVWSYDASNNLRITSAAVNQASPSSSFSPTLAVAVNGNINLRVTSTDADAHRAGCTLRLSMISAP